MSKYVKTIDSFRGMNLDGSGGRSSAISLMGDLYVRPEFNQQDFDRWRPSGRIPTTFPEIVNMCRGTYLKVGIVRNVIDTMIDFATENLRLIHPDTTISVFFNAWMHRVDLKQAVSEFAKHLLIDSNIVLKTNYAKIDRKALKKFIKNYPDTAIEAAKNTQLDFPIGYKFINVTALEWKIDDAGKKHLMYKVDPNLFKKVSDLTSGNGGDTSEISSVVIKSGEKNGNHIELDVEKLFICHTKKDSWDHWSIPFIYAILDDLMFKSKLRRAENCALDGIINVTRLWKLGDHKEGILPNEAAVNKLVGILETNVGGGSMDIVWDSMLTLEEFYPPIDKILGSEKYEQVNKDILIGLGIPDVLLGGKGSSFSNSYIQLKALLERLMFIRQSIVHWLNDELKKMCDLLNIEVTPIVKFEKINIEDENVSKRLIIGLIDRGVLSVEACLEAYGENFVIEMERIKSEKERGIIPKSPFDKNEKAPIQENGRPPAVQEDNTKRRVVKPVRGSVFSLDALNAIETHVVPILMEDFGVSNARKLNDSQKEQIADTTILILSCIKPDTAIDKENIVSLSGRIGDKGVINTELYKAIKTAISDCTAELGTIPTNEQRKFIEISTWSNFFGE